MGTISRKPIAPARVAPAVTVSPAVISTPTSSNVTSTPSTDSTLSTATQSSEPDSPLAREARTQNLLSRSRGRLGTVLTSFRGFFNDNVGDDNTARKTLLGE